MSSSSTNQTIKAPALYTTTPLSFWGGIDPITAKVIDITHPLHDASTSKKIFCLPSGRGSCTGSQVMLELILNGKAPKALILRETDVILCVGVIIAQEFFGVKDVPVICVVGEQFQELLSSQDDELVVRVTDGEEVEIVGKDRTFTAKNLLQLNETLEDSGDFNDQSQAKHLAMKVIRRVASISSATKLIPISSAHIDAVTYIGPGGLRFVQKLVDLGAKVAVPTTLNSQSVDRRRWQLLGVDETYASNANAVGDAYLEMGCDEMSFTCAPYLLPRKPKKGDDIIWGESNAVVYSNSVLGAHTEKYADYFDILAAIVGKVGVHIPENRQPTILLDAEDLIQEYVLPAIEDGEDADSFFPAMGWLCGTLSDGRIPLITGFDSLPSLTSDHLKAFCAAFGTTGTAPLFHMAHVTPEALEEDVIGNWLHLCDDKRVTVTKQELLMAYQTLDGGYGVDCDNKVQLVALGNPHFSLRELQLLNELIRSDNRPKRNGVDVVVTLGRHVYDEGERLNYIQNLEAFGVRFINDTCWCMLLDPPIIPHDRNATILTNSAKYATYGHGLTNRRLRFTSLRGCVEASKTGRVSHHGEFPRWLRSFSTLARRLPK